jgi:large subunit ribosomal protein L4
MATLPVYDISGSKVGTYDIDPSELASKINRQLLHDAVVMYQANLRQGTFRTKTRGEVSGSTKKMYRQKGTGNARAGSKRSGIRRGGGHIFAKRPRDFGYRLPRKALQLATRMAMASKIESQQVYVVNELSLDQPRTATMGALLKALSLDGTTTLIATDGGSKNVYKSARNLPGVTVSHVGEINAWTILRPTNVLITLPALTAMREGRRDQPNNDDRG